MSCVRSPKIMVTFNLVDYQLKSVINSDSVGINKELNYFVIIMHKCISNFTLQYIIISALYAKFHNSSIYLTSEFANEVSLYPNKLHNSNTGAPGSLIH